MPDAPRPDEPGKPAPPGPVPGYPPPGYGAPGYPGAYPGSGPPGRGSPPSPYASYGARVGAWLIDWVITSVIGAVALVPLHAVHQANGVAGNASQPAPVLGITVTRQGALLSVLIVLIYATAFIGAPRGQTIGMMAVGAKAVDAENGRPIGHARALGRAMFEYLMIALLIVPWVLDMLFPLWDQRRQTLHDKVSKTVVIRV